MARNTTFSGYTAALPIVAALTTTCIPERNYDPSLDTERTTLHYVCPIDASSPRNLPDDGKTFSLSFDKHSWSLKGYTDIIDYAQSLAPGMSVLVRAYANAPHGLTEDYAEKRIDSALLFLQRGNPGIDFVSEIVYDAKASAQRMVEVIPQRSRVHEALDSMIGGYDTVLIEQSMDMQNEGLWAALQAYDFSGKTVSLVTALPPDCGKPFSRLEAMGRSVVSEGVNEYLAQRDERVLVISSGLSRGLTDILTKKPRVAVLSPETLEGDGLADGGDTGRTRRYGSTY